MIDLITINAWLDTKAGEGKTTAEAVEFLTNQQLEVDKLLGAENVELTSEEKIAIWEVEKEKWFVAVGFSDEIKMEKIAMFEKKISDEIAAMVLV